MDNYSNFNRDNQNQQNQNEELQNQQNQQYQQNPTNQQNQTNWNPNANSNWNPNQFQNEGYDPNRNVQGTWSANGQFLPNQGQIKDVFSYLLLGCFVLTLVINILINCISMLQLSRGADYTSLNYVGLSLISTIFNIVVMLALIVFLVLDIYQISKAGYSIVGLILFGIFLRPAYFLWRAYILKRNKTIPIVITVCTSILAIVSIGFSVGRIMTTITQMSSMY